MQAYMVRVAKNVELTVIEGMVVYLERLEANDGFYYFARCSNP